jgi:hypothetical protein
VKGLSKQIIAEARCMASDSYTAVPDLGNVTFNSGVFAYMEKPAKDHLVGSLKAHPGTKMTVASMLRTIAQQFLLYSWYKSGRCGIGLAATPGNSNHETGLAIDVSQYSTWKGSLQAHGFHWLGSSDPVHFDYAGAGAKDYRGIDVKAFQRLWNRNHPSDKIATDGEWGPQTEARMKKAPAGGFAKGAICGSSQAYDGDTELAAVDRTDDELQDLAALAVAEAAANAADAADVAPDTDDLVDDDTGAAPEANDPGTRAGTARASSANDEACSSCFQTICDNDSYCCTTSWDETCVAEGMTICEALCGKDAMQPL